MVRTKLAVLDLYERAFNQSDFSAVDQYVADDYVYQNPFCDAVGRQQIIDLIATQQECFRNYRLHLDDVIHDPSTDMVAICWTMTGIFEKDFFGYPATGNTFRFGGVTIQEWRDGIAVRGFGYSNIHELIASRDVRHLGDVETERRGASSE